MKSQEAFTPPVSVLSAPNRSAGAVMLPSEDATATVVRADGKTYRRACAGAVCEVDQEHVGASGLPAHGR